MSANTYLEFGDTFDPDDINYIEDEKGCYFGESRYPNTADC